MKISNGNGLLGRGWLQHSPLRFLLPALVWSAAAAIGGLFVYGCGSSTSAPKTFVITVAVTGLAAGQSITVTDTSSDIGGSDTDTLTFSGPTTPSAPFAIPLDDASSYQISVTGATGFTETCVVGSNGTSTSAGITANITVAITCGYTVGGTLTGVPSGTPQLDDNGATDTYTYLATSGAFTLDTPIAPGDAYAVTMPTPPTGYSCPVTGGDNNTGGGVIGTANVTSVVITCTPTTTPPPPKYTITANVTGLTSGNTLKLANTDNTDTLTETANGAYPFATALLNLAPYDITVTAPQPTGQTCTPGSNANSSISAANVIVNIVCVTNAVTAYSIGGTISGLTAAGLVLQDNGGDNDTIAMNASNFTFATKVASGKPYNVTILADPPGLNCTVGSISIAASGNVGTADITNIPVVCNAAATSAPTILGVLTNVQSMTSSAITSTITLYNLASSTSAPTMIGTLNNPGNVSSIAIDAANNVYFLANPGGGLSTSFYSCPAPAPNGSYVCGTNPLGTTGAIPQGNWLAVDAHGNAYATQYSQATGVGASVVRFPVTGPATSNMTVVYESAGGNTTSFYGLAVTPDGTTALYVSEGPFNSPNGFDITMHACGIPCTVNGGTDVTQQLVNMTTGSLFGIGGAVAIGPSNAVYFGLAYNNLNQSAQPNNITVALNCTSTVSGATVALVCKQGIDPIPTLSNGLNPPQQIQPYTNTSGIAADPSGNTYVGILLEPPMGQSFTAPAPATFLGFPPPAGSLGDQLPTDFTVTGPPGPIIGANDYDAPNYQIAITQSP
jgi:hypothetical protein